MTDSERNNLAARLAPGSLQTAQAFESALAAYRTDPCFCIPPEARRIAADHGQMRFVVLGTKEFGQHFIRALQARGLGNRIMGVVDDFRYRSGDDCCGVQLISTDKLLQWKKRLQGRLIAINSCRYDYARRIFKILCDEENIPLLSYEQALRLFALNEFVDYRVADWGPVIAARADEFRALAARFNDQRSVETLWGVLLFQLTCNLEWLLNVARPYSTLYFRSGLMTFHRHEKMVDCGASIGESISALIDISGGQFERGWLVEPDRINIAGLEKMLRRYQGTAIGGKLSLHPFALGETAGEVAFNHVGGHGGSIIASGEPDSASAVPVRTIDSIVDDAPTIIKMDIEGAELAALRGARQSIASARPKIMASAYHRATDLLDLPACLDEIAPGYQLGLAHHTEERWDTCLYAWMP